MKAFDDDVWSLRTRKRAARSRRRRAAGLALAVLALLGLMIWLAVIGSLWLMVLFAAVFLGAAALVGFMIWRAVASGELRGRSGSITYRRRSPIAFWLSIGIYAMVGISVFFQGVALLGLAPHWYVALIKSMHSH
jgi:polyferredoxin